jgi:anthranilate synthase component 2
MQPERIVISPGPCTPAEAGISVATIREFAGKIPMLGVCLGHQSIGQAFGGDDRPCPAADAWQDLAHASRRQGRVRRPAQSADSATRYHSLAIAARPCPTAWKSPPGRTTARSWACATVNSRSKACSSTPNRS